MIEIIPAILTDSPLKFKELLLRIEPYAKRIHIDIADGEFVPNKTISGYEELKGVDAAVKFDIHLMVKNPQDVMKEWLHSHADRFIIHVESEGDLAGIIENIKKHKRSVGLALNPETGFEKIEPFLDKIDFVQFMTVHPGFQGDKFVEKVIDKITMFRKKYKDIIIMCDGGVNPETAPGLVKAGVTELVSGSYIVRSSNTEEAIKELQKICTT